MARSAIQRFVSALSAKVVTLIPGSRTKTLSPSRVPSSAFTDKQFEAIQSQG